jgi:hypothetical protein
MFQLKSPVVPWGSPLKDNQPSVSRCLIPHTAQVYIRPCCHSIWIISAARQCVAVLDAGLCMYGILLNQKHFMCRSRSRRRMETQLKCFAFYGKGNACGAGFRRAHASKTISQELTEEATMPRVKQTSKQKRTTKAAAVKVLGAAGLSFSLVGSASASTVPTASIPQSDNTSPNQRFVLSEEEMVDVSLATFYVFDKEHLRSGVQEARGCGGCGRGGGGCGGCRGGGGCRGCGGAGFGCRGCGGCGCGGFGFGGCGYGGWGYGGWYGNGGACCASWGACRLC